MSDSTQQCMRQEANTLGRRCMKRDGCRTRCFCGGNHRRFARSLPFTLSTGGIRPWPEPSRDHTMSYPTGALLVLYLEYKCSKEPVFACVLPLQSGYGGCRCGCRRKNGVVAMAGVVLLDNSCSYGPKAGYSHSTSSRRSKDTSWGSLLLCNLFTSCI